MSANNQFTGLPMPVFTAFGWAGEETAIQFALEQLETFIQQLHAGLSREARGILPHAGLNNETQSVYLAGAEEVETDIYISFFARPMSLEMQLGITDKKALVKTYKSATAQPTMAHRLVTELGPEWSIRLQQIQVDEESGEQANYQDLFKDVVAKLDPDSAKELMEKAAYLNGDDKWVVPFYLSRRFPSEQIAAMSGAVIDVLSEQIDTLIPLMRFLTSKRKPTKRKSTKTKAKTSKKSKTKAATDTAVSIPTEDGFSYVSDIKPLGLRKGFINMTTQHWPFFSINSRTETRAVTVYYDGIYDKASSVWRLQPHNMARLVLSPQVHHWFQDNFEPNDQIQLSVAKLDGDEIQISLKQVE